MNIFKNSQLDFNVPIYGRKIQDLVWDNFVDTIRMPMLQIVEEIVSKSILLINYDFIYTVNYSRPLTQYIWVEI